MSCSRKVSKFDDLNDDVWRCVLRYLSNAERGQLAIVNKRFKAAIDRLWASQKAIELNIGLCDMPPLQCANQDHHFAIDDVIWAIDDDDNRFTRTLRAFKRLLSKCTNLKALYVGLEVSTTNARDDLMAELIKLCPQLEHLCFRFSAREPLHATSQLRQEPALTFLAALNPMTITCVDCYGTVDFISRTPIRDERLIASDYVSNLRMATHKLRLSCFAYDRLPNCNSCGARWADHQD